jgi:membrane fusion protein (multidrug efflux system)
LAAVGCSDEASGRSAGGNGPGRGGRGGPGRGNGDRATPVEIAMVSRGTFARTSTVAGTLEPIRTVEVNAQLSGILLAVHVEEGSRVAAGQALAQIDARELEAQVRSAEASLTFAQSTAQRSEDLYRQKIITAAEYERDRAALAAANASLEQLRTRLGFARIASPVAGVVTQKLSEAGSAVTPQTRLFTVAEVSTLVTRVPVSELEVTSLRAGQLVQLSVDALPGRRVEGRIRRVFPSADSSTRVVPVEVALSGSALDGLRPGFTVRATFRLDTRTGALVIPSRAVVGAVGGRAVFIVHAGKAERRAVRVGPDIDGRMEVLEGLVVGDSVVVAGNALLREGATIRVVQPLEPDSGGAAAGATQLARRDSTPAPPATAGGAR